MKILKETKQPLLSRTRYHIEVEHTGKSTPKKDTLLEEVSKLLKNKPECLKIKHIYTKQGFSQSKIICHSYLDKESLEKIENKKKNAKKTNKKQKAK